MLLSEIFANSPHLLDEAKPVGGNRPLTPAQARQRKKRQDKALATVADVQATNAVRLRAAQRKVSQS